MAAMPITVGAIRKLKADKKKAASNAAVRRALKDAVAQMRKKPTAVGLKLVYTKADTAAKKGVIHKNKAARLKSRLAVLVKKK
jgi:small subunit ribosomal protein S20